MDTLSCRPVEKRDLEGICRMPRNEQELFFMFPAAKYPLTEDQLEAAIVSRYDPTVVLCGQEVVAFANFYQAEHGEYCSIGNVVVDPGFRNRGIGEFLIRAMEKTGIEKYSVREFRLACFNTNTGGILLYLKLGYVPYGVEKRTDAEKESFALIKMKHTI